MTDKDVGELWSYYDANDRESRDIHNLIRKLISERAIRHKVTEETAAEDFDIENYSKKEK